MKNICAFLFLLPMILFGCTESVTKDGDARILMMGDSMFASHSASRRSVGHVVEKLLGEPVTDRSVMGARVIYNLPISGSAGFNISKQYRKGNWDWVILNGGGNDLWFGCGCGLCDRKMNKLAQGSGAGAIPNLIRNLRADGAKVIYVGYLRSPGLGSPIEHCRDDGNELERRIQTFAASDSGVHFVSNADLVPHGDASFHAFDMIHPSAKGSAAMGQKIAAIIKADKN